MGRYLASWVVALHWGQPLIVKSLIMPYVILQTDLCGEIYKAKQL